MRHAVHQFELDQPIGQQPQRPAGLVFGRCRAAQRQQLCLQAAIDQQVVLALGGLAVERHVQAFEDKLLLDPKAPKFRVKPVDAFRSAIVFDRLDAGNFEYVVRYP